MMLTFAGLLFTVIIVGSIAVAVNDSITAHAKRLRREDARRFHK